MPLPASRCLRLQASFLIQFFPVSKCCSRFMSSFSPRPSHRLLDFSEMKKCHRRGFTDKRRRQESRSYVAQRGFCHFHSLWISNWKPPHTRKRRTRIDPRFTIKYVLHINLCLSFPPSRDHHLHFDVHAITLPKQGGGNCLKNECFVCSPSQNERKWKKSSSLWTHEILH